MTPCKGVETTPVSKLSHVGGFLRAMSHFWLFSVLEGVVGDLQPASLSE